MAEPARAVHDRERLVVAHERLRGAPRDLDVAAPGELEHRERVLGGVVDRDVAHHGGGADQVDLRRGDRVEERERVVDAGVDVQDQRDR